MEYNPQKLTKHWSKSIPIKHGNTLNCWSSLQQAANSYELEIIKGHASSKAELWVREGK